MRSDVSRVKAICDDVEILLNAFSTWRLARLQSRTSPWLARDSSAICITNHGPVVMSFAQAVVEPMGARELRARRARGEARGNARTRPVRLPVFFRVLMQRPRASLFAIAGTAGSVAIVINALYLQPGPHPAPIFAIAPPVMAA